MTTIASLLLRIILIAAFAYGFIVLFEHGSAGFTEGLKTEWKVFLAATPAPKAEPPPAPAPAPAPVPAPAPAAVAPAPVEPPAPASAPPAAGQGSNNDWNKLQNQPSDWQKLQSGNKQP